MPRAFVICDKVFSLGQELFFKNEAELEKIIPNYKSYTCTFEYETPVVHGKGYPSCTDLMIYNDDKAFCIEAKRTEPFYDTISVDSQACLCLQNQ